MTYLIFKSDGTYQGQSNSDYTPEDDRSVVQADEDELASVFESLDIEYLPNIAVTPDMAAESPLSYAEYLRLENEEIVYNDQHVHDIWEQVDFTEIKYWNDSEYECPLLYSVEPDFLHLLTAAVISKQETHTPQWAIERPQEVFPKVVRDVLEYEDKDLLIGISTPETIDLVTGDGAYCVPDYPEIADIWNNSRMSDEYEAYELGELTMGHGFVERE